MRASSKRTIDIYRVARARRATFNLRNYVMVSGDSADIAHYFAVGPRSALYDGHIWVRASSCTLTAHLAPAALRCSRRIRMIMATPACSSRLRRRFSESRRRHCGEGFRSACMRLAIAETGWCSTHTMLRSRRFRLRIIDFASSMRR